jgi:hypothetical protein
LGEFAGAEAMMPDRIESARNLSEMLKNAVTILAIVIAGFWTYTKFIRVEAPTLEPRGSASSSIYWNDLEGGKCEAVFDVNFANTGNTSFDVTKLEVRGWKFRRNWITGQFATYLDIDEVRNKGELIFQKTYSERLSGGNHMFIGHYSPTNTFRHSFVFSIDKAPDQNVYFEADFYINGNDQIQSYSGSWDSTCNFPKPATSPLPIPR